VEPNGPCIKRTAQHGCKPCTRKLAGPTYIKCSRGTRTGIILILIRLRVLWHVVIQVSWDLYSLESNQSIWTLVSEYKCKMALKAAVAFQTKRNTDGMALQQNFPRTDHHHKPFKTCGRTFVCSLEHTQLGSIL
jgi:hypothetical protein